MSRLLLVAIIACGVFPQWVHAQRYGPPPNPDALPFPCSDVTPRSDFDGPIDGTCADQRANGGCDQPWMRNSVKEAPEGFCQITCGRCGCSTLLDQLRASPDHTTTLQLAEAVGFSDFLANPGTEVTLLAPTNAAWASSAIQDVWGSGSEAVRSTLRGNKALAQAVRVALAAHVLVPSTSYRATWTSPFLALPKARPVTVLETSLSRGPNGTDANHHESSSSVPPRGGGGESAPVSARLYAGDRGVSFAVGSDIVACKSHLISVDGLLQDPLATPGLVFAPNPDTDTDPAVCSSLRMALEAEGTHTVMTSLVRDLASVSSEAVSSTLSRSVDYAAAFEGTDGGAGVREGEWVVLAPTDDAWRAWAERFGVDLTQLSDEGKRAAVGGHVLTGPASTKWGRRTVRATLDGPDVGREGTNVFPDPNPRGVGADVGGGGGNPCAGRIEAINWVLVDPADVK